MLPVLDAEPLLRNELTEHEITRSNSVEVTVEQAILVAGILLFAGVVASRMSDALGVPAMLVFLLLGMVAGSEGVGGIHFESLEIAQAVGTGALVVILFTGGLETRWSQVKPVLVSGLLLSTEVD